MAKAAKYKSIDEFTNAELNADTTTVDEGKFSVVYEFRDKDNISLVHKVGSDVSHFSADRLNDLVRFGLVKDESKG